MSSFPNLITLCGFMGTGKSAVGKALSLVLKYQFFDSDREIQAHEARSIQQIFESEGEPYFRKVEQESIATLAQNDKTVLSVGGGAIINPANFELLEKKGILILLKADVEEIVRRLGHENERPLLQGGGDRRKKIEKLLSDRKEIYSKVKMQIDTTGLAIDEVVQKIVQTLKKEYP